MFNENKSFEIAISKIDKNYEKAENMKCLLDLITNEYAFIYLLLPRLFAKILEFEMKLKKNEILNFEK